MRIVCVMLACLPAVLHGLSADHDVVASLASTGKVILQHDGEAARHAAHAQALHLLLDLGA